jgi:hypothetical protein
LGQPPPEREVAEPQVSKCPVRCLERRLQLGTRRGNGYIHSDVPLLALGQLLGQEAKTDVSTLRLLA